MKKIKLLLFTCIFFFAANAEIYYVASSGDNTSGLSWETAYTSPKEALSKLSGKTGEVWVKEGIYISSSSLTWINGLSFYGGFTGTETERNQRNTDPAKTILEGTQQDRIMYAKSLTTRTVWNGFTLQKGKITNDGGGGAFLTKLASLENCIVQNNEADKYGGAGIKLDDSKGVSDSDSIKVINCIVRNNVFRPASTTWHDGGGIVIRPDAPAGSLIKGCVIENNTIEGTVANTNGGGISLYRGIIEDCIIQNNSINIQSQNNCRGGGVWINASKSVTVSNCIIANNYTVSSNGGGIWIQDGTPEIYNCHIVNNKAQGQGGGVYCNKDNATTLVNCVFWGNEAIGGSNQLRAGGNTNIIQNCAFENQTAIYTNGIRIESLNTGTEEGKLYANFKSPTTFTGIADTPEKELELAAADWSLQDNSALVDKGLTLASITHDIKEVTRPQGEGYDIGAYEHLIPPVNVVSVTLNESEAELNVGETLQLMATVLPENATNKNVSWQSSNEQAATVDAEGLVTATGQGSATITVKTEDGNFTEQATITVVDKGKVTGVILNHTSGELKIGETLQLIATVLPESANNKNVSWESSNEAIATVDTDGLVTAKGQGTTTITVKTEDGKFTASANISVIVPVTGVTLNKTTAEIKVGETLQLTATILPANADNKNVNWKSSNEQAATVDVEGLVTATGQGSANITVTTEDGSFTAIANIIIIVPVTSVSLNHTTAEMKTGETLQLTATVLPENADNKNISWESSNEQSATVDSDGLVTALKEGTTIITVKTEDGNFTSSATITINHNGSGINDNNYILVNINGVEEIITINNNTPQTVWIFDITGKCIMQELLNPGINTINTSGLNKGYHILKYGSGAMKFIK